MINNPAFRPLFFPTPVCNGNADIVLGSITGYDIMVIVGAVIFAVLCAIVLYKKADKDD